MNCEAAQQMREAGDAALENHRFSCMTCILQNAPYYTTPPGLEEKIRAALRREQASGAGSRWRWIAIAAAVLLTVSLAWNAALLKTRPERLSLEADTILSAHIRSLIGTHLLDVPSSDRHTVKPWFDGKLDFSPPVKDIDGFPLLGGRLEYFGGRPAAALVYGRRKHVIDLFIWPSSLKQPDAAFAMRGYRLRTWSAGGMILWAVSDLDASELNDFIRLFR